MTGIGSVVQSTAKRPPISLVLSPYSIPSGLSKRGTETNAVQHGLGWQSGGGASILSQVSIVSWDKVPTFFLPFFCCKTFGFTRRFF